MKVEDLKNLGLEDEVIKKVQALSGADVTAAKTTAQAQIDALTTQVSELQGQVTQRDTDIADITKKLESAGQSATKLSEVQNAMNQLQDKYTQETASYKKKLDDQKYEFLVREKASGVKFSCNAAKKEFINNLMENRLTINNDALLGFDDYLKQQQEADPDAFKIESAEPSQKEPSPQFAPPPANPQQEPSKDGNPFKFNFAGVRQH